MDTDCELSQDADIMARLEQFNDAVFKIQDMIELVNNSTLYENLPRPDKIKCNLLLSYCLNSLFWMYLRADGMDPSKHRIRSENERLKKTMIRAKQIHDRNTLMPQVNKDAVKRFIRSSLWEPKEKRHKKDDEEKIGES